VVELLEISRNGCEIAGRYFSSRAIVCVGHWRGTKGTTSEPLALRSIWLPWDASDPSGAITCCNLVILIVASWRGGGRAAGAAPPGGP
jgi:hypothetical protein